jgi:hypothetical protein
MLNVTGRSALVKATMSAILIHMSIALCLSPWAFESTDKLRWAFIWCGSDAVSGGRCKVAWEVVGTSAAWASPTYGASASHCGYAANGRREQMIIRRSNQTNVQWWLFQAATVFTLGNGESIFWTDRWLHGSSVKTIAPAVFDQEEGGDGR